MRLTFSGTNSGVNECPALYDTDRGTVVVQGWKIDRDDQAYQDARNLAENEDLVEVPRELLERYAPRKQSPASYDLETDEEWNALFRDFKHSARRLETRDHYDVSYEREHFDRFLAGEESDGAWMKPWTDLMRGHVDQGKTVARVRVVPPQLTDYLRWELDITKFNIGLGGEDIRYLDRATADRTGLPDRDFWLFDSHTVVVLHFNEEGRRVRTEVITDPAVVIEHARWLDVAFQHATAYEKFVKEHPPR
ncbi:DUF6879 family protein [Streptomyces sp. enrichment culture]|uniref:DUF6879 family protein n=1 Tax=Streptomyces sp. enrichment culture TaxID=1795815 RepID=UPI003F574E13